MSYSNIAAFRPDVFQSLPSVEEAADDLDLMGGLDDVWPALSAVAAKHPVSKHFGVQLLHRHSTLAVDEIMIARGNVTFPVRVGDLSPSGRASVTASIWALDDGANAFVPLEFTLQQSEHGEDLVGLDSAFACDIADTFKAFGLQTRLGLARLSARQGKVLETTHGRANVVQPLAMLGGQYHSIEVLWRLGAAADSPQECVQVCRVSANARKHRASHEWIDFDLEASEAHSAVS